VDGCERRIPKRFLPLANPQRYDLLGKHVLLDRLVFPYLFGRISALAFPQAEGLGQRLMRDDVDILVDDNLRFGREQHRRSLVVERRGGEYRRGRRGERER
jgi:hypothetical protein